MARHVRAARRPGAERGAHRDGAQLLFDVATADRPGAMRIGFTSPATERLFGFGERSDALDERGHDVENHVSDGPFPAGDRQYAALTIPPQGSSRGSSTPSGRARSLTASAWTLTLLQSRRRTAQIEAVLPWRACGPGVSVRAGVTRLMVRIRSGKLRLRRC